MGIIQTVLASPTAFFIGRATLMAENLALGNQLTVRRRSARRPKLRKWDRIVSVRLSGLW